MNMLTIIHGASLERPPDSTPDRTTQDWSFTIKTGLGVPSPATRHPRVIIRLAEK